MLDSNRSVIRNMLLAFVCWLPHNIISHVWSILHNTNFVIRIWVPRFAPLSYPYLLSCIYTKLQSNRVNIPWLFAQVDSSNKMWVLRARQCANINLSNSFWIGTANGRHVASASNLWISKHFIGSLSMTNCGSSKPKCWDLASWWSSQLLAKQYSDDNNQHQFIKIVLRINWNLH